MALAKRYEDGFNSLDGIAYRVEIWQEGYTGSVQSIAFSPKPLVLKWSETDKLAPVQSSSATLRLFSDTDRQFLDLYTVKAGAVRMDVYRDGQLYWSGTLDPELYEEPYSYKERYTVELTFSDFAILDRIPWSERGFIAIAEVIRTALTATGIQTGGTVQHVSTRLSRADEDLLARIAVSGMNFFDEDDEPMTLRKVLEETLRPFALRIVQKAGRIHVYDLNALCTAFTPTEFYWSSDDAILGADAVYNNVKITYSPYGVSSLADASVDKDSVSGETYRYPLRPEDSGIAGFDLTLSAGVAGNMSDVEKNLLGINSATPNRFSKMSDVISEIPTAGGEIPTVNSEIWDANSGEPGISKSASAAYFRVTPLLTGSDDSGVAQRVVYSKTGTTHSVLVDDTGKSGMAASLPQRIFLCNTGNFSTFRLRLKVEMLVDDRLNPYDEDQGADLLGQDKDDVGYLLNEKARIWYQNAVLRLYSNATGGTASYSYMNTPSDNAPYCAEEGSWTAGEGEGMLLCYYEEGERKDTCAVRSWKTNKQLIWNYWDETPYLWRLRGDGEFIPLPPTGGYLDFQVLYQGGAMDYSAAPVVGLPVALFDRSQFYRLWHLFRSIKLDLVDAETYKEIPQEDIETTAWLNPDAKEELAIDTIVGCMDAASPIAKGQLFDTEDGYAVVSRFSRAGVMDRLEKLLIGTVYSNYATRHHTLSGETDLLPAFTTYTDRNLPGVYLLLKETQDLEAGTSSVLAVQVDEDEYQGA